MLVEFRNVTISIEAADAKAAYDKLCTALCTLEFDVDWVTDHYVIVKDGEYHAEPRDTKELWPR